MHCSTVSIIECEELMDYTRHARQRSQQRGIPPLVVDLLLQFGHSEPAGQGTRKIFLDKSARKRLNAYAGSVASVLSDHLDVFAVVDSADRVITVGHRTEHIRRS